MKLLKKYAKHCRHCFRNMLLPYEYEFIFLSWDYNVIKGKHELFRIQQKRINFISRIVYIYIYIYIKLMKVKIMIEYVKFYQN